MEPIFLTIAEASERMLQLDFSPVDLTELCLERIAKLNPQLNAWITVDAKGAREQAHASAERILNGARLSPLDGIPLGLKDNIDTAGLLTTAGSNLFRDRVPTEDAEVVRLLRRAGVVILGKLNLHEFAYGGSNYVSAYGPTRNPWNPKHLTGGSSGGAAVAVATGMCLGAIGTDTAGSIRLPAACCGVVGLKPTFGLVSCEGVIPLSWSLDHTGPITQTVEDAALLMDVLSLDLSEEEAAAEPTGADGEEGGPEDEFADRGPEFEGLVPRRSNSGRPGNAVPAMELDAARILPLYRGGYNSYMAQLTEARKRGLGYGLRLGVPREHFMKDLDPGVAEAFEHAMDVFRSMDGEIVEVDLPVDTDRTVQAVESYTYHEHWVSEASPEARPQDYQPETLRRIRTGAAITAPEYIRARLAMDAAVNQADALFRNVDAIVTPTCPVPAPAFAQVDAAPEQLRPIEVEMLRNTRPFNVMGLPAISVPCGFTPAGLPVGLQIASRHGDEATVLIVAWAYEQATAWHKRRPKV